MADSDPIRPAVIWLSPMCEGCERHCGGNPEEGQLWCTEPQDDCSECGLTWTRYVLSDKQPEQERRARMEKEAADG